MPIPPPSRMPRAPDGQTGPEPGVPPSSHPPFPHQSSHPPPHTSSHPHQHPQSLPHPHPHMHPQMQHPPPPPAHPAIPNQLPHMAHNSGDMPASLAYPAPAPEPSQGLNPAGAHYPPVPHQQQYHPAPVTESPEHGPVPPPFAPPRPAGSELGPFPATPYSRPAGAFTTTPPPPPLQRRKPNRAAQACNTCRAKKQKCDEKTPCGSCAKDGIECQYRGSQQSKPDRVLDVQRTMVQTMDDIRTMLDHINRRLSRIEHRVGIDDTDLPAIKLETKQYYATAESAFTAGPDYYSDDDTVDDAIPNEASPRKRQRRSYKPLSAITDNPPASIPPPGGGMAEPEEGVTSPTLNLEHTTGAHHLSKWKHVSPLFSRIPENYIMFAEREQGLLRPGGTGPAIPACFHVPEAQSPRIDFDARPAADGSDNLVSAVSPPMPGTEQAGVDPFTGGLDSNGELNLDERTVLRLKDSYMIHMHRMHPFLNSNSLDRTIRLFLQSYGTGLTAESGVVGLKRPRPDGLAESPGLGSSNPSNGSSSSTPQRQPARLARRLPDHTIQNAVVLLVLALGRVLEHGSSLPSLPAFPEDARGGPAAAAAAAAAIAAPFSPSSHDGHGRSSAYAPSPTDDVRAPQPPPPPPPPPPVGQLSPLSTQDHFPSAPWPDRSAPSPFPFPPGSAGGYQRRLSAAPSGQATVRRNMEVIPGMAYYAYATSILGGIAGGHTLNHVYAYLLAGLFMGQLARVTESWHWINLACRTCILLVKQDLDLLRHNSGKETARRSRPGPNWSSVEIECIKVTFWTCLQLEGDILAEFETLPHSGITAYESVIGYPATMVGEPVLYSDSAEEFNKLYNDNSRFMFYYCSQIFLRKMLNQIHARVYGKDPSDADTNLFASSFFDWRKTLPEALQWDDEQYQSNELQMCRLRGKFYGGGYLLTRPSLLRVLQFTEREIEMVDPAQLATGPCPLQEFPVLDPDPVLQINQVVRLAKWCIWFAIRSTTVFDGLEEERWRVTNIHGTLTAQYSNMLAIYAAYRSFLRPVVERVDVVGLFARTIRMLDMYAGLSLSLRMNAWIMRQARAHVVGETNGPESVGTDSFGAWPRGAGEWQRKDVKRRELGS